MRVLIDNECREDARQDDAKLVAARTANGTPFSELLFIIFRVEERIVNLEPIIVYLELIVVYFQSFQIFFF